MGIVQIFWPYWYGWYPILLLKNICNIYIYIASIVHAWSPHQDIMIFFLNNFFMGTMEHCQFYFFINQLMRYIHRKSKKNKAWSLFYPGEIVVYILVILSQKNVCEREGYNLVWEKREKKNAELCCYWESNSATISLNVVDSLNKCMFHLYINLKVDM